MPSPGAPKPLAVTTTDYTNAARLVRRAFWCVGFTILAACSVTRTVSDDVEIAGPASEEQKVKVAQTVAATSIQSGLKARIRKRLPAVDDSDLDHLQVGWTAISARSLTDAGKGERKVMVQCSVSVGRDASLAHQIVAACKDEIAASVTAALSGASKP